MISFLSHTVRQARRSRFCKRRQVNLRTNVGPRVAPSIVTTRRGFSLIELIGALAILAVVFAIVLPTLLIVARERQAAEQRQFALQHASNLLEEPVTRNWNELPPGELALPEASSDLRSVLPNLERKLLVRDVEDAIPSRQLTVSIRWRNSAGQTVAPIEISTFVFRSPEDKP